MTELESTVADELLKADALGRVRVRPEQRERMLDAFESSAMSGQAFAIHHGIKVQTFASWMQKRRRSRGDYEDEATRRSLRMPSQSKARSEKPKPRPAGPLSLIEVQVSPDSGSESLPPLEVVLPGGAVVRINSESQIGLLKTLLRELSC